MPGLLQTGQGRLLSFKFFTAFAAEFIGTMLFAFFGGAIPADAYGNSAWLNGLSLAVFVYVTANISGGHLNPAITLPTIMTGHTSLIKGIAYIIAQLCGSTVGSLLLAGLYPGLSPGNSNMAAGCFQVSDDIGHITKGMAFGWECIMTFTLVAIVYSVALGEPNFGNVGPLVIGLVQAMAAFATANKTGAAINPARALGPTFVFQCNWSTVWVYVLAELAGGLIAGLLSWPLYGSGKDFGRLTDGDAKNRFSLTKYFTSLAKGGYRGHKHAVPLPVVGGPPLDAKWTAKDIAHLEDVMATDPNYPATSPILRQRTRSTALPHEADGLVDPMGYTAGATTSHMDPKRAGGMSNGGAGAAANQNAGDADPMGYTNNTGASHMDPARQAVGNV
ncbi:hypothetical protein WJX74_004177 [Apatococcus lobatus]|uniref:Aquaporin n=2 Tax=Apatococcus TaxID=904362 RepID=A0AAW1RN92_9CHLO